MPTLTTLKNHVGFPSEQHGKVCSNTVGKKERKHIHLG